MMYSMCHDIMMSSPSIIDLTVCASLSFSKNVKYFVFQLLDEELKVELISGTAVEDYIQEVNNRLYHKAKRLDSYINPNATDINMFMTKLM